MFKKMRQKQGGFTLLEMVAVIFIIALLIILFLPNLNKQRQSASGKVDNAFVKTVQTQVDLYEADKDVPNVTFDQLAEDHYLTADQAKKAKDKLTLEDGEVTPIAAKTS